MDSRFSTASLHAPPGPLECRNVQELTTAEPLIQSSETFLLRLYVAGQTPKCIRAFANLKRICEEYLVDRYHIEMVDLLQNPQLARGDQILAVPTLVRRLPEPIKKIIGDLSNTERVLVGLDLRPASRLKT